MNKKLNDTYEVWNLFVIHSVMIVKESVSHQTLTHALQYENLV